jgi:hypothetical protein
MRNISEISPISGGKVEKLAFYSVFCRQQKLGAEQYYGYINAMTHLSME